MPAVGPGFDRDVVKFGEFAPESGSKTVCFVAQIRICIRPVGSLVLVKIRSYQFHHSGIAVRKYLPHPLLAIQGLVAAVLITSRIDLQDVIDVGLHLCPAKGEAFGGNGPAHGVPLDRSFTCRA